MTVFRSRRDGKLYLLADFRPPKYTGRWMQCARFYPTSRTWGLWKDVRHNREKDFDPVFFV